jgi:hypothetical protein
VVDLKADPKEGLKENEKFLLLRHNRKEERGLKAAIKCSPSVA